MLGMQPMNSPVDRGKIFDRRAESLPVSYNARVRPDRRINSISVEWLPADLVALHPTLKRLWEQHNIKK
jgi:hypothetical protein